MRRFLSPPVFAGEEQSRRARVFHVVAWGTILLATASLVAVMLMQPSLTRRATTSLLVVDLLGLSMLELNRRGWTRLASALLVGGLMALVSVNALIGGGIRSPGVQAFYAFALMAAVLLGERVGVLTALACWGVALGLVVAERLGMLQQTVQYSPWSLWLLNGLYMGVVIMLVRLATQTVGSALRRAESELAERRQAERQLDRSRRYLDELIETASVLIVEIDLAGRLVRANRCFEEVTGYGRAELQEEAWLEQLQPPQRYPEAAALVRRYLREGWPREVQAPLLDRTGREHLIAWRNSAVRDQRGQVVGTLAVGADITEQRRAEEDRQRLQESLRRSETLSAIGSLVAGVAHEVRNPLFGIAATLDAFEAELGAPPATREYLDVLRRDVGRLRRVMDDLLAYGRQHPLSLQVQALPPLIAQAIGNSGSRAAARDVRLAADLHVPLPHVPVDADRLLQVLENLLENAIELSQPGGNVVVAATFDGGAAPALCVEVRDEGPGFLPEDLPRVFEPFFSRRQGGTGMGLAIVQKIVVEHGGSVSARNGETGGALVEVRLPVGR